jgi:hypothetical protein
VGIVLTIAAIANQPSINADGRCVAVQATHDNILPGNTSNNTDVFLQDTCPGASAPPGCTVATTRSSVDKSGVALAHSADSALDTGRYVSGDGRFVVFDARGGDVVPSPSCTLDAIREVFVRDTCNGRPSSCGPSTTLVSVDNSGGRANQDAVLTGISSNGRVITFQTPATNLTSAALSSTFPTNIYARDACLGASAACSPSTILVSVGNRGAAQTSGGVDASADDTGRYVSFFSVALTATAKHLGDIFLRDTCIGAPAIPACTPTTILVSAPQTGLTADTANSTNFLSSVNGNGRFVLYDATLTDLVSTNNNGFRQAYLRDTCIGAAGTCTPSTQLISADTAGTGASDRRGFVSGMGSVSSTGRFVVFTSGSSNLVSNGSQFQGNFQRSTSGSWHGSTGAKPYGLAQG